MTTPQPSSRDASRTVVVVDADACVPDAFIQALPIHPAPADAPLLLERETVSALSLERGVAGSDPTVEACASAASHADTVLYVNVGDRYGAAEDAVEQARVAVAAQGAEFTGLETGQALMGAGWSAVVAAEAIARGRAVEEAVHTATLALRSSRVLALIEHPELSGLTGTQVPNVMTKAVTRLEGDGFHLVTVGPRRDHALQALRDQFATIAATEAETSALRVAVHHAGAGPAAEAMARWIERHTGAAQVVVAPLTRHAATRLGPGMVGIAWIRDPDYEPERRVTP